MMKHIITQLNKQFENRVRLGVMSVLMANEWADFITLKEMLDVTDGNLASHITALEKAGYVEYQKKFVGKKPKTAYKATSDGRKAFEDHLNALEDLIKNQQNLNT